MVDERLERIGDLAKNIAKRVSALGSDDMTEMMRVMPMAVDDLLGDELEADVVKAAVGAGAMRDLRQGPRSGGTAFYEATTTAQLALAIRAITAATNTCEYPVPSSLLPVGDVPVGPDGRPSVALDGEPFEAVT